MIKLRFLRIFIITIALCYSAIGCAPLTVLSPVAAQNERNAIALKANVETLALLTDSVLPAILESGRVAFYRDTLLSIRHSKYKPQKKTKADIQTEYEQNAKRLKDELDLINPNLLPAYIEQCHRSYPLTSAVAVGQISADQASAIWLGIEQAMQMSAAGIPKDKVFKTQMTLIADLPSIKQYDQAKQDIIDAYAELRKLVLEQADNSVQLSKQIRLASETSTASNALLKGVMENDKVIQLIGESVAQRTGDPERKKAATALLESIKGDAATLNLNNTGK